MTYTPQTEPIAGTVPNSAGGYAFAVDDWTRLNRFLVLGTEGGSYYASERDLTKSNVDAVKRCLAEDGVKFVKTVVDVSKSGRAPKNDPALFALALAISHGDATAKHWAKMALPDVARIGTHLFHFVAYADAMRGWGRALRSAVAHWYESKSANQLAYQMVKYQSRDKWSHKDLIRLAHVKTEGPLHDVVEWAVKGTLPAETSDTRMICAFERVKELDANSAIAADIRKYRLPREAVPTESLNSADVWRALLDEPMPMTAMIRNLATMTRLGVLTSGTAETTSVINRLNDASALSFARVHPIHVLTALMTYKSGASFRGTNTWSPVTKIVDALDAAFYKSFGAVTPTNKRVVLALDVSGSMANGNIAGVPGLTPRVGAAAMALVTAAVEPSHTIVGFTAGGSRGGANFYNYNQTTDGISVLSISPRQRLDDVVKATSGLDFGPTDCALPMLWALEKGVEADAFVIYTDSETWAGQIHPKQALDMYRQKTGIPAKLVVVGMVSNGFSIADPNDAGMLDCVGMDTSTPNIVSDFVVE